MRTFIDAIQGVYLGWNTAGRISDAGDASRYRAMFCKQRDPYVCFLR